MYGLPLPTAPSTPSTSAAAEPRMLSWGLWPAVILGIVIGTIAALLEDTSWWRRRKQRPPRKP